MTMDSGVEGGDGLVFLIDKEGLGICDGTELTAAALGANPGLTGAGCRILVGGG